MRGGWTGLEHPADRDREPYPSFFSTEEVKEFMQQLRLQFLEIDQCMYGALGKEPTGLLVPRASVFDVLRCNHSESHPLRVGLDDNGHFRTTPAAKYPVALCCALAVS